MDKRNKTLQLQADIAKSKRNVQRNHEVYEECRKLDASKTVSVSDNVSSNLLVQFGRGKPEKEMGSKPKNFQKSDKDVGSPAKRARGETSRPGPAENFNKPSSKETDKSKMPNRQGYNSGGNAGFYEANSSSLHFKERNSKYKFNGPPPPSKTVTPTQSP